MTISFIKNQQLSSDIYSLYFQKPKHFDFKAGQYLKLYFGNDNRSFTIASSPTENQIMITTKLRRSEFKQKMLNLKENDQVKTEGPMGGFYFKPEIENYVFLSGGMGITPFRSMIKFITNQKLINTITLFASFSNTEDVLFFYDLKAIEQTHPHIKIIYNLSNRHSKRKEKSFEQGRLSKALIKKYIADVKKPQYMIVGPPDFVAAMEDEVDSLGVKPEQIQIENFTGY